MKLTKCPSFTRSTALVLDAIGIQTVEQLAETNVANAALLLESLTKQQVSSLLTRMKRLDRGSRRIEPCMPKASLIFLMENRKAALEILERAEK